MTSLTQTQKDEIARQYRLKIENKNIATFLGLSKHIVNNYIYKEYLKTNERSKYTSEHYKNADQVIEMYKLDFSYKQISERTGLRHHQICEVIKLTTYRRRQGITIKNLREVQRLWEQGMKIANISYKLELSYGQVQYWVRKMRSGVYTSLH
jgi:DNA-binding NarL/FixJ family response regulator